MMDSDVQFLKQGILLIDVIDLITMFTLNI